MGWPLQEGCCGQSLGSAVSRSLVGADALPGPVFRVALLLQARRPASVRMLALSGVALQDKWQQHHSVVPSVGTNVSLVPVAGYCAPLW